MNVRVELDSPIYDGKEVIFKAPCNASEVTGLKLCYQQEVHYFTFADANANDVGDLDNLFAVGAVVKVILDTDTNKAFIQNADTNSYLEQRFNEIGAGGGVPVDNRLVVTLEDWQKHETTANYDSLKIYEHIESGGTVLLHWYDDTYIEIDQSETHRAVFSFHAVDNNNIMLVIIDDDGNATKKGNVLPNRKEWTEMKENVGNISDALDAIIAIQNELIGGDGV